ncbi:MULTISPECIES: Do family serine endopeptidase [unclassified Lentimicrobium]|uniref:Do family serine endopeptidase n=1 Tax=unclassified Lentimicrobium TaxID=2677434 RepID=UPI0015555F63|nr:MULTISPECIES: Do family serine endopeptidase [unclassified Lentimicrobium]NPD46802.1 Do family serine endopeptidase [Lentimicrobium sp. S6]NPD85605.1 Do family serine endopeptidase [Lentimicrobium sp. L6]
MQKNSFLFVTLGVIIGVLAFLAFDKSETPKDFKSNIVLEPASYAVPKNVPNFVDAAESTVNGVVHIKTKMLKKSSVYDFFYDFFGHQQPHSYQQPMYMATGSGVIISKDGYIVTNNHVVEGAHEIEVILNDKRSYQASLIGTDPSSDLAVIKIEEDDLPYLQFGNSEEVKVGEWVLAVGNPFNLTSTVTAGIVSAKARNINILGRGNSSAIESFIQTDAAVNKGNSGGALVDTEGKLIGINAAIASNTGSYTGYAFAIPSNLAQKVVGDLIQFGEPQRGYLGVSIAEMDSELAEEVGLDQIKGVYLARVMEDGAAGKAGIEDGAVVLQVEGQEVNSAAELMSKIAQHRPGEIVQLSVFENGRKKDYNLTLRNVYGNTKIVSESDDFYVKRLGAAFDKPDTDLMKDLNINHGMQITAIRSGILSSKGIKKGFIIKQMNKQEINSISDIRDVISNVKGGLLIEGIYPNGQQVYYGIGL